jgi:hypothetical protein
VLTIGLLCCVQFDRQVTRLRTNIQHAGDVELAKQLARKGVRPGTLSLDWGASDDVAAACGAALASGELQPLLQDVTSAQLTHHAVVLPSQLFMVSSTPWGQPSNTGSSLHP